jgi:hypothetical protein
MPMVTATGPSRRREPINLGIKKSAATK